MKRSKRIVYPALAVAAAIALVQGCSKKSSTAPAGPATTLDVASVSTGISEMSSVITVCRKSGSPSPERASDSDLAATGWLDRALQMRHDAALARAIAEPQLLGSTKPADKLGGCGGRITYPSYNHSNGTTTGTYAFESYCTLDSSTGEKTTLNGSISFTDSGTPSASGPITNKVQASSSAGVTMVTRSSTGAQLSSQKLTFEDYVYTPGVPGGTPTSSKPDTYTAASLTMSDAVTGKSYRQTDYRMSTFTTSSGGEQMTVSGRGYRSSGEYYDFSTTSPVTTNSSGSYTGGQITFKGANNSTAVLTVVPGSTLQGTMTVNGTAVTSVPVCK